MKIQNWRRWLPSIRIRLKIPFITIDTKIIRERDDMDIFEWYGLDIQIWEWSFDFALYWKRFPY